MRHLILNSAMAILLVCSSLEIAAADDSSSHHFIKDSTITTRLKAKLAAKHLSSLTRVKIDTDENGVVWLSGRAPTQDASELAASLAKNTEGVSSVHNNIVVEP